MIHRLRVRRALRARAACLSAVLGAAVLLAACDSEPSRRQVIGVGDDGGPDANDGTGGAPGGSGGTRATGGTAASGGTPAAGGATPASGGRATVLDAGPVPEPEAGVDAGPPLVALYVEPSAGLDTNDGTIDTPFKTLQKAAAAATALGVPTTIHLGDGTYDATNQTQLTVTFPPGVTLQGQSPGGVILKANSSLHALLFTGAGGVHDVNFDSFQQGISAMGTGTFDVSGVHFTNSHDGMYFRGSLVVTVDASDPTPIASNVAAGGFSLGFVVAEENADVTVLGGTFDTLVTNPGGSLFFARSAARLTLSGAIIRNMPIVAVTVYDNADVVLDNVSIRGISQTPAVIPMGGQNTAQPLNPTLTLRNGTEISQNTSSAIVLSLYGNLPSKPVITLDGAHLDGNSRYGIQVTTPGVVDPALVASLGVTNSTINANTLGGIVAETAVIDVTGGAVVSNGADGIALTGATYVNSLKVRGGTVSNGNLGHAVSFAGAATSVLDLGKTGDPGGIVFSNVAAAHSAVNLLAAIRGSAIGNTWIPNVQNADATGKYLTPRTLPAASAGLNATIAAGGSLVVAE